MATFPSNLGFASVLQYRPRGDDPLDEKSRAIAYAIKDDRALGGVNMVDSLISHLADNFHRYPELAPFFGDDTALIPVPRSSPLVPSAHWPARRIAECIVEKGLAQLVLTTLTRTTSCRKSATAGPGERPGPQEHYDTTAIEHSVLHPKPKRITIVDDVITRGATFIGIDPRIRAAYPNADVRYFAVVRTKSYGGSIASVFDIVTGTVSFDHRYGSCKRNP